MKFINELYTSDVLNIIAQHFGVEEDKVKITEAFHCADDGPYVGGYRVTVQVEVDPDKRG